VRSCLKCRRFRDPCYWSCRHLWRLLNCFYTCPADNFFTKVLLIFGDAFEIGIVEFVHNETLIEKLEGSFESIVILFYKRANVEFELIGFASVNESNAFVISLFEESFTFWRKAV
jgi:hypothetical protein